MATELAQPVRHPRCLIACLTEYLHLSLSTARPAAVPATDVEHLLLGLNRITAYTGMGCLM